MKCPVCSIDLTMTDRQGVEIDYCSKCRGVWLDRGELDKIIERSDALEPRSRSDEVDHDHHGEHYRHGEHHSKYRKRQGFLGRMLDFD